jgi:hypothetical protein
LRLRGKKRPSLNEIESVLRQELEPHFSDLERLRRRAVYTLFFSGSLALAIIGFTVLAAPLRNSLELIGGVSGVLMMGCTWIVARSKKEFSAEFKTKVMTRVAARFFPELKYRPSDHIERTLYHESQLFRQELDTYTGNDYFTGRLGEVDFQFSELLCQYTTGSGKNRRTVTAFRGFFFVGDFHRDIYFRTLIQPDLAESLLGVLGRGLQRIGKGERLVDLENPEFEKLFVVTSDDQVEARYILTPLFMEKLCDFQARVGQNIHLCFVNGRMMLAIETDHDYFEPGLFGEILSRKDLMKFIDMLNLLISVADEFLHHPKFGTRAPVMPHRPVPPPLTAAQRLGLKK